MQTQMEICELKGDRKITMEASKAWFRKMRIAMILEKMGKGAVEAQRAEGGARKRHFYFTYIRGSQGGYRKNRTDGKGRNRRDGRPKSLYVKNQGNAVRSTQVRKLPNFQRVSRSAEMVGAKMTFATNGNQAAKYGSACLLIYPKQGDMGDKRGRTSPKSDP